MEAVTARQLPVKQQREKVSEFDNELEQEASNVITAHLGETKAGASLSVIPRESSGVSEGD
jgi:hypothetical protein